MTERERELSPEEKDLGGEELVDGTAGGSENVLDAEHAPPTGTRVPGLIIAIFAFILLIVPVVWAVAALVALAPIAGSLAVLYACVAFLIGAAAAYWAYLLLR